MKTTTLTVNKKGTTYGFRKGNCYFTKADLAYYDRIYAIKGRGVTDACIEKIRSKNPTVVIEFLDDQGRIQSNS